MMSLTRESHFLGVSDYFSLGAITGSKTQKEHTKSISRHSGSGDISYLSRSWRTQEMLQYYALKKHVFTSLARHQLVQAPQARNIAYQGISAD